MIDPKSVPFFKFYDGSTIPGLGMGTFGSDRVSPEDVAGAVAGGIRAGYRLFDCAACYGNEAQIGQSFKAAFDEGVVKREDLFIMSKVWNDMHRRVAESARKTIADLQCDYLDMLFIHWPFPNYHAPGCSGDSRNPDSRPFHVDEFMTAWRQCEQLVDEGKTRYIGMSNMTIPKLEAVLPLCRIHPAALEMELHPSFQQPELYDYAVRHGILPIGFCPMGSPSRPARDHAAGDVSDFELPGVAAAAKAHGVHPAVICLKWAVSRGQIPIPFSVKEPQLLSNLRAVTEDPLTEAEKKAIAQDDRNCRLVKGQVFLWPGATDWRDLWDEDGTIVQ